MKKKPSNELEKEVREGKMVTVHYQPATTVGDWGFHPLENQIIFKTVFLPENEHFIAILLPASIWVQLPVQYQFLEALQWNQMTILYLSDANIEMLQILI